MKKLFLIIYLIIPLITISQNCYTPNVIYSSVVFEADIKETEHDFSIDDDVKIHFVLGNLQFNPSTKEWRLAPQQFDYVGGGYDGDADLPAGEYGTIYVNGVKSWNIKYPTAFTGNRWIDAFNFNDIPDSAFVIDGKTYRVPTKTELSYLVSDRPNADQLRARAQITLDTPTPDGNTFVNGLLLLPDDWDPKVLISITITPDLDGVNGCWYYTDNILTEGEWYLLEAQGAVFLPAAGNPTGRGNSKYNRSGFYWTTTDGTKLDTKISLEFGGYPYKDKNGVPQNSTASFQSQSNTFRRSIRLCREINE